MRFLSNLNYFFCQPGANAHFPEESKVRFRCATELVQVFCEGLEALYCTEILHFWRILLDVSETPDRWGIEMQWRLFLSSSLLRSRFLEVFVRSSLGNVLSADLKYFHSFFITRVVAGISLAISCRVLIKSSLCCSG